MERRFEGKVALVTGATNGIGQATAVRLAAEGAVVAVNQRPTGDPAETLRRIGEAGGEGFSVVARQRGPGQGGAMGGPAAARAGPLRFGVADRANQPVQKREGASNGDFYPLLENNRH